MTAPAPPAAWNRAWALLDGGAAPGGPALPADVRALAGAARGFLSEAEGITLFQLAAEASAHAPCLEIGSYCGKSTLFLGAGCRSTGRHPLFAIDHHRGSEEQQPGQAYFDPDLFDAGVGRVDTLPALRANLARAGLEDWVIPVVARSAALARLWPGAALGLVFVDGAHGEADVRQDADGWAGRVRPGGYLCFHDVYPDPKDGGQAPYRVFEELRRAPGWSYAGQVGSLGILRR
jgi:predicted O-methyltransferase YrrM